MTLGHHEAMQLSPLQLAYIGDAAYELKIRQWALGSGCAMQALHQKTTARVCAAGQARALQAIQGCLTEEEAAVVKRGRNAHARHAPPRSASCAEYAAATGLEALMGYLHLTGKADRLHELLAMILNDDRIQEREHA